MNSARGESELGSKLWWLGPACWLNLPRHTLRCKETLELCLENFKSWHSCILLDKILLTISVLLCLLSIDSLYAGLHWFIKGLTDYRTFRYFSHSLLSFLLAWAVSYLWLVGEAMEGVFLFLLDGSDQALVGWGSQCNTLASELRVKILQNGEVTPIDRVWAGRTEATRFTGKKQGRLGIWVQPM